MSSLCDFFITYLFKHEFLELHPLKNSKMLGGGEGCSYDAAPLACFCAEHFGFSESVGNIRSIIDFV